jgi:hypothetical protein
MLLILIINTPKNRIHPSTKDGRGNLPFLFFAARDRRRGIFLPLASGGKKYHRRLLTKKNIAYPKSFNYGNVKKIIDPAPERSGGLACPLRRGCFKQGA